MDDALVVFLTDNKPHKESEYIIHDEVTGQPISQQGYQSLFASAKRNIDLHGATAHVFRHTYLTLLDHAGVKPKIIQLIAGHGDIRITLNRYVHGYEKDITKAGKDLHNFIKSQNEKSDPQQHPN